MGLTTEDVTWRGTPFRLCLCPTCMRKASADISAWTMNAEELDDFEAVRVTPEPSHRAPVRQPRLNFHRPAQPSLPMTPARPVDMRGWELGSEAKRGIEQLGLELADVVSAAAEPHYTSDVGVDAPGCRTHIRGAVAAVVIPDDKLIQAVFTEEEVNYAFAALVNDVAR